MAIFKYIATPTGQDGGHREAAYLGVVRCQHNGRQVSTAYHMTKMNTLIAIDLAHHTNGIESVSVSPALFTHLNVIFSDVFFKFRIPLPEWLIHSSETTIAPADVLQKLIASTKRLPSFPRALLPVYQVQHFAMTYPNRSRCSHDRHHVLFPSSGQGRVQGRQVAPKFFDPGMYHGCVAIEPG